MIRELQVIWAVRSDAIYNGWLSLERSYGSSQAARDMRRDLVLDVSKPLIEKQKEHFSEGQEDTDGQG